MGLNKPLHIIKYIYFYRESFNMRAFCEFHFTTVLLYFSRPLDKKMCMYLRKCLEGWWVLPRHISRGDREKQVNIWVLNVYIKRDRTVSSSECRRHLRFLKLFGNCICWIFYGDRPLIHLRGSSLIRYPKSRQRNVNKYRPDDVIWSSEEV